MPLDSARVRALCFDVDGTLSDTDDYYVAKVSSFLRRLPAVSQPEKIGRRLVMWLESPGNFLMGVADRLSLDDELAGVVNWLYRHQNHAGPPLPSIPGVPEMLASLRERYPMAIVSTRGHDSTLAFLEQSGLRPYFNVVVTALTTRRTKPFPDPVFRAAQEMKVEPEACVMIGDTTVDIRAGRAAGAQTVGVLCGFGEQDELLRSGADLILQSTADLADALGGG